MQLLYAVNDVLTEDDVLLLPEVVLLAEELLLVGLDVEGELLLQAASSSEKPNNVTTIVANLPPGEWCLD